jgi:hypothetical protein
LTTEDSQPSQTVIMGLTGGPDRWLKINLAQSPLTFVGLAQRVTRKTVGLPFFGRVTSFVVNFSPDESVSLIWMATL